MKNVMITSLLAILFISPMLAQEKMQKSVKERATEKVTNLDKELKLSETQKKELQVYFEGEMNQMADTRDDRMQERKKMRENRNEMRERRATQRANMTQRRDSRMERMQQILTPEQYEKWLSTHKENREEFQRNGRARSEMNTGGNENTNEGKRTKTRTRGQR